MVQVIYIESSGKTWSPLGDRYLSALIAQRLARSLRKWKASGSNPTLGKDFFHFAIHGSCSSQVKKKPIQMKSTMTYSALLPSFRKRFARKNMAAVSSGILLFMSVLRERWWSSSWLAEQEVGGSITWISEIGYLLLPSLDMVKIPLKWRKSSMQPTN